MYNTVFAIDELTYPDRKLKSESVPKYFLRNFNHYLPKLESEFYLKLFLRELLFEIDILEIEDFLQAQYDNSKDKNQLLKILELKVLILTETIITNAQYSTSNGEYTDEKKLEDGFIESQGIIKNSEYDFDTFYHLTFWKKLQEDLKLRKQQVQYFLNSYVKTEINPNNLQWSGKPSHLAFLIRNLIDEGYITGPLLHNKEINITEVSRQILKSFSVEDGTTINTLRVYLDIESKKHKALKEKFKYEKFYLPNSGFLG